jgi:predicted dinucleotide-binding enzyme
LAVAIVVNIGIIGMGNMGSALGKILANNGHKVLFSYSRNPQKLRAIAESASSNAQVGTPAEAAQFGEVVFLGVQWIALKDALQAAGSLEEKC